MTRRLTNLQMGFYFTLGVSYFEEDADTGYDYFDSCLQDINTALKAMPCWSQTIEEINDPLQIYPYALLELDPESTNCHGQAAHSFWVSSERIVEIPAEHVRAMRDAIASCLNATFVGAQCYREWAESGRESVIIP